VASRTDSYESSAKHVASLRALFSRLTESGAFWFLCFAVFIAMTQLGSLEHEVLDWDESTFALMAQDVAHGNLPYVNIFENKPPMLFLTLGLWIKLFGENIVALRLFGDLCFLIVCVFTFFIGKRITSSAAAGFGVMFLIAVSASRFAQHTQAEHLAMAFLMPAIWLMGGRSRSLSRTFGAGLLVSLAVLTRTNLAYVALFAGVYQFALLFFGNTDRPFARLMVFGLGGLLPIGILCLVYWTVGALSTLILTCVEVPLANANADRGGVLNTLHLHRMYWRRLLLNEPFVYVSFVGSLTASTLLALRLAHTKADVLRSKIRLNEALLAALMCTGVVISMVQGGKAWLHYWNQVLPFLAILLAVGFALLSEFGIAPVLGVLPLGIALGAALSATLPSAYRVVSDWPSVREGHFIRKAADDIRASDAAGGPVWATDFHLILFYLDQLPLSRVLTHPANMVPGNVIFDTLVAGGYVPSDSFQRLVAQAPEFIVLSMNPPRYFPPEMAAAFQAMLDDKYALWRKHGPLTIMRADSQPNH
jgi:4-amino-4-deoxy-L-arabinose transferase-like glycosyltransferase